jgi:ATP-dependent Clp protease ATP-binding subunit ClpX
MDEEVQIRHMSCDFCGKARSEVKKLIVANEASICNECIELCSNILDNDRLDSIKADRKINKALDPIKVRKFLDQYIIGQDTAKIALSVAVVNHYKRVYFKPKIELEKSNLLMFGPSGSGKTLLAKTVARYLNVPFVIADATTLTQAGYVGEDVESLVGRLLSEADNDVARCERGIIFIDEIDKIGRKSESASIHRDVGGEGVQQALLKMVEGTKCRVTMNGNKKHPAIETVEIDTSNILFIAGGAFDGMRDIIDKRRKGTNIGFTRNIEKSREHAGVLPEDFMKYGMIPEFIGRFPVAVELDPLTLEDFTRILIEPKNSLLGQMKFYFSSDNVELEFDDPAILAIAQQALDLNIGARGLKTVLEQSMMPFMYGMQELKKNGVKLLSVTENMITTNILTQETHEI